MTKQHYKSMNTIWNSANMDEIESKIEKLPVDTIVKCSKTAHLSQPEDIKNGTLMLLAKYGIKYVIE